MRINQKKHKFFARAKLQNMYGMTLVEVLVTIFILGLIFALSMQALTTMLVTRKAVPNEVYKISDLERVFDRIGYDFINASFTSPVSSTGYKLFPVMASEDLSNGALAQLTISVLARDDDVMADGQLIGYRLNGKSLEFLLWKKMFLSPADEVANPQVYKLLDNVNTFKVQVKRSPVDGWVSTYPNLSIDVNSPSEIANRNKEVRVELLPVGLKIEIAVDGMPGVYTRVFNRIY